MSTTNQELTSTETNSLILIKKWLNDNESVTKEDLDIECDTDASNIAYRSIKADISRNHDFKLSSETVRFVVGAAINDAVIAIKKATWADGVANVSGAYVDSVYSYANDEAIAAINAVDNYNDIYLIN